MKLEWDKLSENGIKIITEYCENDMKLLKRVLHKSIDFKSIPGMYHDDVYGNAMLLLVECAEKYDETKNCRFDTFFSNCAKLRSGSWTRDRVRAKRCNVAKDKNGKILKDENNNNIVIENLSLDFVPDEDSGITIAEMISDGKDIENEVVSNIDGEEYSKNMKKYLSTLSKVQVKILKLLSEGYTKEEIIDYLHIDTSLYQDSIAAIKSLNNTKYIKCLIRRNNYV